MRIEWSKVWTNAVSAVVVAIVLGACAIVWRGATSVDDKIEKAFEEAEVAHKALVETQSVLGPKVDRLEMRVDEIVELLKEQDPGVAKIHRKGLAPIRDPREPRIPAQQIIQGRVRDWESTRKK